MKRIIQNANGTPSLSYILGGVGFVVCLIVFICDCFMVTPTVDAEGVMTSYLDKELFKFIFIVCATMIGGNSIADVFAGRFGK